MKLKVVCDFCGMNFERESYYLKGKNIISVVDNVLQISAIRKRSLTDTTNLRILHL